MEDRNVEGTHDGPTFPWYNNRFLEKIAIADRCWFVLLMLIAGDSLVPPSTELTPSLCAVTLFKKRRGRFPGDLEWPGGQVDMILWMVIRNHRTFKVVAGQIRTGNRLAYGIQAKTTAAIWDIGVPSDLEYTGWNQKGQTLNLTRHRWHLDAGRVNKLGTLNKCDTGDTERTPTM